MSRKEVVMDDWGKSVKLSDRQLSVMKFIKGYMLERGTPSTIAEIGEALGLVKSVVWKECNRLRSLRFLTWEEGRARTMKITAYGEMYLEAQNEQVA